MDYNTPLPARLIALPATDKCKVEAAKDATLRHFAPVCMDTVPFAQLDAHGHCRHEREGHLLLPAASDFQKIPQGQTVASTAAAILLITAQHCEDAGCTAVETAIEFESVASEAIADIRYLDKSTQDHREALPHLSGDYKRMAKQRIKANTTTARLARACAALAKRLRPAIKRGENPQDFLERHLLVQFGKESAA